MKRWNWYLPELTKEQAAKLREGLLVSFRFNLSLAVETVNFQPRKKIFWVKLHKSSPKYRELLSNIGYYINGYYSAIKS
jgi:hypothetical protein